MNDEQIKAIERELEKRIRAAGLECFCHGDESCWKCSAAEKLDEDLWFELTKGEEDA